MALQLKKAQRSQAYIKVGISAPSGGGKTVSALLLGYGLLKEAHPDWTNAEVWAHIAVIDTENGSGELYVNSNISGTKIGEYNAITLTAPFEADKYTQAIDLCQEAGMEVCIIDSATHLWSGEGGLLEQQSNAAKRTGNSYTAWRDITPQHNRFVESMLQSPMHVIATMRAKQEYVQEKDEKAGKSIVRKLGMEPEQRKGMEYEFTIFFEIDAEHVAKGTKDRTSMFDQRYFTITPKTGQEIMKWLAGSTEEPTKVIAESHKADPAKAKENVNNQIIELCKKLGGSKNDALMEVLKKYDKSGNPNTIKDPKQLSDLYIELTDMLQAKEQTEVAVEETVAV
jgi:hypothetical protein